MLEQPLDIKLVQRVCELQRALDQALVANHDLSRHVQDQHLLEHQLVVTEQFANVQQQIIGNLLQQLEERYHEHQHTQDLLTSQALDAIQHHQTLLQRLQTRIVQGQTEVQAYLRRLPTQSATAVSSPPPPGDRQTAAELYVARILAINLATLLQTAQVYVGDLWELMHHYSTQLMALPPPHPASTPPTPRRSPAPLTPPNPPAIAPAALLTWPAMHQSRIAELEAEITAQLKVNAQLKHRCQELAAERDYYQTQAQILHHQNAEMKEYLLHQADLVGEQKIAIQYWQDQISPDQRRAIVRDGASDRSSSPM